MLHVREIREHPQQEAFSLRPLMHHIRPLSDFQNSSRKDTH